MYNKYELIIYTETLLPINHALHNQTEARPFCPDEKGRLSVD